MQETIQLLEEHLSQETDGKLKKNIKKILTIIR